MASSSHHRPPRPVLPPSWQDIRLSAEDEQLARELMQQSKWQSIKDAQYRYDITFPPLPKVYTTAELFKEKVAEGNTQGLQWDETNSDIFSLLCEYFTRDAAFEEEGRSLEKGLLLVGPVGCGKTTLLRLFMQNPRQRFGVLSCRQIAGRYQQSGADGLAPYLERHYSGGGVFDDLGNEPMPVKYYGTDSNTMADVLLARYDEFQADRLPGDFTHLTTNLPVGAAGDAPGTLSLYGLYGQRVVDRMREMFNLIAFPATAPSRRK